MGLLVKEWKMVKFECTLCSIIYDLPLHEFCVGQVDRVPAQCLGGHRFESCWGLRFFLCPTLVTCWLFHFSQCYFCCHIVICFVKTIVISLCFILIDGKNVSFVLCCCFHSILIKSVLQVACQWLSQLAANNVEKHHFSLVKTIKRGFYY